MNKRAPSAIAYSYLRFSSPEQAKGDSLRRQTELRDNWLKRNGIILDTTLKLQDEGISGFSGKHRQNPDRHALAAFLEHVRAGRIARGSYLIVESLDRLTREHIRPALTLLLNLIDNGIRIVQLLPIETIYDDEVEPMSLMMAIMELSRGHSESRMKSERLGRAWQAKRVQATANRQIVSDRTPGWIGIEDKKFVVLEDAAGTVRRIYRLAIDGYGIGQITRLMNDEGNRPIGRLKYWARSYVAKILTNRAVLGEYQPYSVLGGKKRAPEGETILNYFPPIITEADFYAARAAMTNRRKKVGRAPRATVNVFANLLHDARNGGTLVMRQAGKKGNGTTLVSYLAKQGVAGTKNVSFPFVAFERAILSQLKEIDPSDIVPKKVKGGDALLTLVGRLEGIDGRLEKIKAALLSNGDIDALVQTARTLEDERQTVMKELDAARQLAATPLATVWGTCKSLIDLIDRSANDKDVRVRLRAAIRRVVSGVYCLFIGQGSKRIAFVQLWFHGSAGHRDYVIVHLPKRGGILPARDERTSVRSMRYDGPVDLRERTCVRIVEDYVATLFEE